MKNGNESISAPLGVLAEIASLLAAITPEQFIAPPLERKESEHVVATATDDIKRLYTLRDRLDDKCRELAKSGKQVSEDAMERIFKLGHRKAIEEMETPGSPLFEANVKNEQILAELQRTNNLHKIVDGIFWLEVRRQHPDIESKPVAGIRSDWSLTWAENDDDDIEISIVSLVDGDELAGLTEMLSRRTH